MFKFWCWVEYFELIILRKKNPHFIRRKAKNLQVCFVNDGTGIASVDTDSPSSDSDTCPKLSKSVKQSNQAPDFYDIAAQPNPYSSRPLSMKKVASNGKGWYFVWILSNICLCFEQFRLCSKLLLFIHKQLNPKTTQRRLISLPNKHGFKLKLEWPWHKPKIWLTCKWR